MFEIYNSSHSIDDADALAFFDEAVVALARHRPGVLTMLDSALARCPDFIAAHVVKGFANLFLAYREYHEDAEHCLAHAQVILDKIKPKKLEICLVTALRHGVDGHFLKAADVLEEGLREEPINFLMLKLSYGLRFMAGDPVGMLRLTSSVLPKWSPSTPAAGYFFGCHAFALEEAGHYRDAERCGLRALSLAPDDAWGLHALCHVQEMEGRIDEGIAQIETSRKTWQGCNNFRFHVAWHLALFYIEAGRFDDALTIYDREIRAIHSDDYRDFANASSLLKRLQHNGVDVGHRWNELAVIAIRRADETSLMFASLHQLMALLSCGLADDARLSLVAWQQQASRGATDQSDVASHVGILLFKILMGEVKTDAPSFEKAARELSAIGGSFAQRDVFLREVIRCALGAGHQQAVQKILALRGRMHAQDRFHRAMLAQCLEISTKEAQHVA